MPDIHIHRPHGLGLARAREIAAAWAQDVESRFDITCNVVAGAGGDTVEFRRTGVSGTLVVAADQFVLDAKLGFLLGAFSKAIESEIAKNLDALLDAAPAPPPPAAPGTAR